MPAFLGHDSPILPIVKAVLRWQRIMEAEGKHPMTPDGIPTDIDAIKSALLSRLLHGDEPLPHRPATAYSYPWYELELRGIAWLSDFDVSGPYEEPLGIEGPFIAICQSLWRIQETFEDGSMTICYHFPEFWTLRPAREYERSKLMGARLVHDQFGDHTEPEPQCTWVLKKFR